MTQRTDDRTCVASHVCGGVPALDDDGDFGPAEFGVRENTRVTRHRAVERVVDRMRENLAEPFALDEMAELAMFSPYHFHRVFRVVTGLPPAQFCPRCAWRAHAACC